MFQPFPVHEIDDFEAVLSAPRFATYLRAEHGDRVRALHLYCWNTEVSEAFYTLLQFCEVAVRNGAVQALEAEFGENWHLNRGFAHTLRRLNGGRGYQPADDLRHCAANCTTAGKVVAELKFAFWQYLAVKGQDKRLWLPQFETVFPGFDRRLTIPLARAKMHGDLQSIRKFRNRIAHHEPVFNRNLAADRDTILRLVEWRRPSVATWLREGESITRILATRP